jgi:hypothetical protein
VVVIYLKALFKNLPGENEENHAYPQDSWCLGPASNYFILEHRSEELGFSDPKDVERSMQESCYIIDTVYSPGKCLCHPFGNKNPD